MEQGQTGFWVGVWEAVGVFGGLNAKASDGDRVNRRWDKEELMTSVQGI